MIPFANIKNIMKTLASDIGLTIIRANQPGAHPNYPFASYNMISSFAEGAHQNIKEVIENAGDSTQVDLKQYEADKAVISITFLDKNRVDRIYNYATLALQWFKSITGREYAKSQEITVQLIGNNIQDRSVFQEAFHENRVGFDVRFDYSGLITDTIEDVESIVISQERDGESLDDLTVNIP